MTVGSDSAEADGQPPLAVAMVEWLVLAQPGRARARRRPGRSSSICGRACASAAGAAGGSGPLARRARGRSLGDSSRRRVLALKQAESARAEWTATFNARPSVPISEAICTSP